MSGKKNIILQYEMDRKYRLKRAKDKFVSDLGDLPKYEMDSMFFHLSDYVREDNEKAFIKWLDETWFDYEYSNEVRAYRVRL